MVRLLRSFCLALLVVLASIGGATPRADAAPSTAALDALRADLQQRHDNDYGGTLTRTQRRELAAIDLCLARIDGAHAAIEDDAATLKFVAKKLAGQFRPQFDGSEPGPLPGLLADAATGLIAAAEAEYGTLAAAIDALVDPALAQQLQSIAGTARTALDDAADRAASPAAAAAAVRRAARAIARGLLLHADATAEGVRCKMKGRVYTASSVGSVFVTESGGDVIVSFNVRLYNPVTRREESFVVSLRGEVGAEISVLAFNPFFPFEPNIAQFTEEGAELGDGFYPRNGECFAVIQSYDAGTGTATGTFSFRMRANPNIQLPMTKGSFRLRATPPSK